MKNRASQKSQSRSKYPGAGLFKSQERAKQEANSLQGMSVEDAHLPGNIGNPQEIEQGQQKTVEHGEYAGSVALAHLTVIFAQRHIASPMQAVFNRPMLPHQFQQPRGRGLGRREAGDAIDHLRAGFAPCAGYLAHPSRKSGVLAV
jgi:hypothetical protein